jgi:simple sugar transport system permease protein
MNADGLRRRLAIGAGLVVLMAVAVGLVLPDSVAGTLLAVATRQSTIESGLRFAVPIALAAVGGIFAEKAGVINIGLEGLLIVSALGSVVALAALGPTGTTAGMPNLWVAFLLGVLTSTLFSLVFAVVCIEFKADQIIAGLAVWLIALGVAPFLSTIVFGGKNTDTVGTFEEWSIPLLSEIPYVGPILFAAGPDVYVMLVGVAVAWYVLNRTSFGRWVIASGENPKALDTAGIDVRRVRYAGVLLSGVYAGLGGAGFALGQLGRFAGGGQTDIQGRGFIAIATYLFGNYNPVGALGASFLFSGLNAMQIRLQAMGIAVPSELIRAIPYVVVIVVLVLVGRTRIPAAAGDHYESGED